MGTENDLKGRKEGRKDGWMEGKQAGRQAGRKERRREGRDARKRKEGRDKVAHFLGVEGFGTIIVHDAELPTEAHDARSTTGRKDGTGQDRKETGRKEKKEGRESREEISEGRK